MADAIEVSVDLSDTLDGFMTLEGELNYAGQRLVQRIVRQVERQAKLIMLRVFEEAVAAAGESFPSVYASHLRAGLQSLPFVVEALDTAIEVTFDDIEELGDWSDIIDAVHYHAILDVDSSEFSVSNPPYSDLGEDLDSLYGPNHTDRRQEFWDALVVGADFTVMFGRGSQWTGVVPTAGMYEETLNARVQFWGNRYPEWIILDEGLDGIPGSLPTHFVSLIGPAIENLVESLLQDEISPVFDEAISSWDSKVARYRGPGGRFVKGPPKI